jgi:hypothetical protein
VENEDDAMVVYTFELLPEGSYAPTGVFHSRIKLLVGRIGVRA